MCNTNHDFLIFNTNIGFNFVSSILYNNSKDELYSLTFKNKFNEKLKFTIRTKNNSVILKLYKVNENSRYSYDILLGKGKSRCHPCDNFNFSTGFNIAFKRLMSKFLIKIER